MTNVFETLWTDTGDESDEPDPDRSHMPVYLAERRDSRADHCRRDRRKTNEHLAANE